MRIFIDSRIGDGLLYFGSWDKRTSRRRRTPTKKRPPFRLFSCSLRLLVYIFFSFQLLYQAIQVAFLIVRGRGRRQFHLFRRVVKFTL